MYSPTTGVTPTPSQQAARDRFNLDEAMAALPYGPRPSALPQDKAMLIDGFSRDHLKAKRVSPNYLGTLSRVLGKCADADHDGTEFLLSGRDDSLGTQKTLRTVQRQLLDADLLAALTRSQGRGFVGKVYVYNPAPPWRGSKTYEQMCREVEGEGPTTIPDSICLEDIPH